MAIQSLNPYTGVVEQEFQEFEKEVIKGKINIAQKAYQVWAQTTIKHRKSLFKNLLNVIEKNEQDYALLSTKEMGKLYSESLNWEIQICKRIVKYYIDNVNDFLSKEKVKVPFGFGKAYVEKLPLGGIFGIMPWNYPYYQVLRFVVPNIIAGNVCFVKHASNVPQCALAIESMFKEAGFPEGIYTNLFVSSKNIEQVVGHSFIQGVSLTGSERAGASVAALAGKHLKKVVLELGGSDPFIVLKDADVSLAAEMAFTSRFFNAGQSCVAAKRFIVESQAYDTFVNEFLNKVNALIPGDPIKPETNLAPFSRPKVL